MIGFWIWHYWTNRIIESPNTDACELGIGFGLWLMEKGW